MGENGVSPQVRVPLTVTTEQHRTPTRQHNQPLCQILDFLFVFALLLLLLLFF